MLEKIKTLYNPTPGMPPDKIGPTVGQNSELASVSVRGIADTRLLPWVDQHNYSR